MAYNPDLVLDLDRARFELGDTGSTALLADETIEAMHDRYGYTEGTARCADALAARYAQEPDEYTDEQGNVYKWKERVKAWLALAKRLRTGGAQPEAIAANGGRTVVGRLDGPKTATITGKLTKNIRQEGF